VRRGAAAATHGSSSRGGLFRSCLLLRSLPVHAGADTRIQRARRGPIAESVPDAPATSSTPHRNEGVMVALTIYMDVHIPAAISDGLRRNGLDVVTSQED